MGGNNSSKLLLEKSELQTLKQLGELGNLDVLIQYIEDNVSRWKNEKVKLAITGRSAAGKSTFINEMRNVRPGQPTFAKTGSGNTTRKPEAYEHPEFNQIVFYDLPGVGTLHFLKETYIQEMKIDDYDYFLIFYDTVISEDDGWIIKILKDRKKPFCLVRSKLDVDIANAQNNYSKKDEESVISGVRKTMEEDRQKYNALHPDNIIAQGDMFLISSREKQIGDMEPLIEHIRNRIPAIKFEILMYSVSSISNMIIKKKYEMLNKRKILVTLGTAAISAIPVSGLTLQINTVILTEEIRHYTKVFSLTKEEIETLPESIQKNLRCRNVLIPDINVQNVITQLATVQKGLTASDLGQADDIFNLSAVSSTSAAVAYIFLGQFLKNIRDDAISVFDFRVKQATRAKL